jgi:uncharacterized protein with FMN-binding domain
MKKKLLIALGIVAVVLVAGFLFITDGLSEGAEVTLNGINLSDNPDGSYTGTYDFKRWTNTVVVQVKGHKITAIDFESDVAAAGITGCADEMFRRVIEAQDTKVDAVSGATVTSKASPKLARVRLPTVLLRGIGKHLPC